MVGVSLLLIVALLAGGVLMVLEASAKVRRLYKQGEARQWRQLAKRLALTHGRDESNHHMLDGRRQGVWLRVWAEGVKMVVQGRIEATMPAGLQVLCHDAARGGLRLGNPVLDGLVHAAGGEGTIALLSDPDLTAPLLTVVHAHPGSVVDERHVVLRYTDALGRELDERCQEVVELVQALRQAARSEGASAAAHPPHLGEPS